MFWFILPFLLVSLTFLILGLIRPEIINHFLGFKLTRLKIIIIFGLMTITFASLIVYTAPRVIKQNIAGVSTSQPVITTQPGKTISDQKIEPEVKKSSTGICHLKGTTYYDKTKNYKSFSSLETCLRGGGRLPKK